MFYKLREVLDVNSDCPIHIPEKYHGMFNTDVCLYCGKPLYINHELTILRCTNVSCPQRLVKSLVKVMQGFGIKGCGQATIQSYVLKINEICDKYQTAVEVCKRVGIDIDEIARKAHADWENTGITVAQVIEPILQEKSQLINDSGYSVKDLIYDLATGSGRTPITNRAEFLRNPMPGFIEEINKALSQPRTFAEATAALCIPDLGERAEVLFKGCDSLEQFMEKGKIPGGLRRYIQQTMVQGNSQVLSNMLFNRVLSYSDDLAAIPSLFNIVSTDLRPVYIVITGNVTKVSDEYGARITKRELLQIISPALMRHGRRLVQKKKTSGVVNIVVSDTRDSSNYTDALEINQYRSQTGERPIIICSSAELIDAYAADIDPEILNQYRLELEPADSEQA